MPFFYKISISSTSGLKDYPFEISIPSFDENYDNYERLIKPKFQNYEILVG
jgi:hypothetical protein